MEPGNSRATFFRTSCGDFCSICELLSSVEVESGRKLVIFEMNFVEREIVSIL